MKLTVALAAVCVVIALIGAYAAAYYLRSIGTGTQTSGNVTRRVRVFSTELEATVFTPAATAESLVSGNPIVAIPIIEIVDPFIIDESL